jgi:hypothetical protein
LIALTLFWLKSPIKKPFGLLLKTSLFFAYSTAATSIVPTPWIHPLIPRLRSAVGFANKFRQDIANSAPTSTDRNPSLYFG